MRTALLLMILLTACLPRTGHSQVQVQVDRNELGLDLDINGYTTKMTWEQLSRHAGLVGLETKTRDQFRVLAMFQTPRSVYCLKAEIDLTPTEWDRFAHARTDLDLLSYWTPGGVGEALWKGLVVSLSTADSPVDVSKIPLKNDHIVLTDPHRKTTRLYILCPDKDGKAGSLFYFFLAQKVDQ